MEPKVSPFEGYSDSLYRGFLSSERGNLSKLLEVGPSAKTSQTSNQLRDPHVLGARRLIEV